jgi:hypothetical protein
MTHYDPVVTEKGLSRGIAQVLFLAGFCQLFDLAAPLLHLEPGFGGVILVLVAVLYARDAK